MGQLPFVMIDDCFSCMTNENKVKRLGKMLKCYENETVVEETLCHWWVLISTFECHGWFVRLAIHLEDGGEV